MTSPADPPRRQAARAGGFTLIEMLVVLGVLGLAAGLLALRGPPRSPAAEARVAAVEIAQALRLARARAIAADRPVAFLLDLETRAFRVGDGEWRRLPPGPALLLTAVSGQTLGERLGAISFAPDGSSSGGRIELAVPGRRLQIGVDWLTGRVQVAASHAR